MSSSLATLSPALSGSSSPPLPAHSCNRAPSFREEGEHTGSALPPWCHSSTKWKRNSLPSDSWLPQASCWQPREAPPETWRPRRGRKWAFPPLFLGSSICVCSSSPASLGSRHHRAHCCIWGCVAFRLGEPEEHEAGTLTTSGCLEFWGSPQPAWCYLLLRVVQWWCHTFCPGFAAVFSEKEKEGVC